jgi:hypothetical protein
MRFEKPSEIQASTLPLILDGHNVIAQAQSGAGEFYLPCRFTAYGAAIESIDRITILSQSAHTLVLNWSFL